MSETRYRPFASLAVVAGLTAATGTASFLFQPFVVVAVAGLIAALLARRAIHKYQLSGLRLVLFAIATSVASIVFSPMWHMYRYHSETLPNHIRIAFDTTAEKNSLDAYDGKQVCMKGYSLYFGGDPVTGEFLLSPDGNFRKTEAAIKVVVPRGWRHEIAPIAVSGVLHVDPGASDPVDRYTLTAVKISTAKTSHLLAPQVPGDC